ncbi:endonuclease/exonuclease/phosphatase family protein [Vibrio methylphosphonaticus]|uniref:endonuclease/exonuclease/phosphatase family protein n=1 Tax=Vibrio methylphosphonaticus TaxID=2946866 RepID=UPI00202A3BCC|nr:endonuclease/exonuclease/phosphatase family protein [Vibrio methylphosphonaticus]MCL9776624.1 endonuclease/exonuclease/phosphatase family protein [Vibrio methylphosphonaticus]
MWIVVITLPTMLGLCAYYLTNQWALENAAAFIIILPVFYLAVAFALLVFKRRNKASVCVLLMLAWLIPVSPMGFTSTHVCSGQEISVLQYNVYYDNHQLDSFIQYVRKTTPAILILQEVSPTHGEQLKELTALYPYQYGGQRRVGYPSGQMILSQNPLYGRNVVASRSGHRILKVIWRATEDKDIYLIAAHPPSPRTKQLWIERNEVINDVMMEAQRSPLDTTLVVGDFNLSSTTARFAALMPGFQTQPIASWPSFIKRWLLPFQPVVAIDHLWVKGPSINTQICQRQAITQIGGSDHVAIRTDLHLESTLE